MRVFQKLPLLNLLRRPVRSSLLLGLTALLSFAVFGGYVMTDALSRGMTSLRKRLGADIMVVPAEAEKKSALESIVLQGNPTYFYMEDTKLDEVSAVDGVGEVSPQLFLASLAASCCSAKVQLMGYEPGTDFVIRPWIRDACDREPETMEVVVGSDINSSRGDRILFYDVPCTVAAKLSPTGTNYDRCVFAGEDTIRTLTKSAVGKHLNQFKDTDPEHVISCILVNVKEGADIEKVAEEITGSVDGVTALRTGSLVSGTARSMSSVSGVIRFSILITAALAFLILVIAFTMQIHERKREFAVLRVCGVSGGSLAAGVLGEIALVCAAGGIAGCGIAALVLVPFSGALKGLLDLPMLMPGAGRMLLYFAVTVLLCVAAGVTASAWNIWKVSREEISLALREE